MGACALTCDGFDHEDTFVSTSTSTDDPETSPRAVAAALSVEKRLRGGRHCDVLHSHETSDFRRLDTLEGRKTCAWVSLPFSVDDASIHARVARQAFDDCEEWVDRRRPETTASTTRWTCGTSRLSGTPRVDRGRSTTRVV